MQIVVNIPEEVYNGIISKGNFISDFNLANAFKNAIILPKRYGKLIDADKAVADYANYGISHMYDATDLPYIMDECPTILEANED